MSVAVLTPGRTGSRPEHRHGNRSVPLGLTTRVAEDDDAHHILGLLDRMSEQSRLLRFLRPVPEVTPDLRETLTLLDDARVIVRLAFLDGRCVGESRLVRTGNGAELALMVADAYQRQGIGRELLRQGARDAFRQGIEWADLYVHPDNRAMIGLLCSLGTSLRLNDGTYEGELDVRAAARA